MVHRSRFSALPLPLAFALLISFPTVTTPEQNTAESQLQALITAYETSLNAADVNRIYQLYTEDGVVMPAGYPTMSGRTGVRDAYNALFKSFRLTVHSTVDELKVSGDLAYAVTHSTGTFTILASGVKGPVANRELFVFARGADGWKIARYVFNKAS